MNEKEQRRVMVMNQVQRGELSGQLGQRTRRHWPNRPTSSLTSSRSINALMESFWSHVQVELRDRPAWSPRVELATARFENREIFHHRQRRHSSLGMLC